MYQTSQPHENAWPRVKAFPKTGKPTSALPIFSVARRTESKPTDRNLGSAAGLAGVVWTNLPCKFTGQQVMPSEAEVIAFLRALDGSNRVPAERYIRQAPTQIDTLYRQAIERELGWLRHC